MQRTPRRCMVRVRGGEAYLQVPAAHPIRARLVMGQWEQERSLVAPKAAGFHRGRHALRSEEHTSELQSLMRISYAVFCLKTQKTHHNPRHIAPSVSSIASCTESS